MTLSRAQQSCKNCDAFIRNEKAPHKVGEARIGHCVAGPPMLMQGMAPIPGSHLSPNGPQMMPVVQGAWPPTDDSKWCRAWQERMPHD